MNKIILLPLKEMPKNCYDCKVDESMCDLWQDDDTVFNKISPQCPLIQIDTKKYELAIECLDGYRLTGRGDNALNTLRDLLSKLGVE